MRLFWCRKQQQRPKRETYAERATRMRLALKYNPTTGEQLITRRYRDACIDEIIHSDREAAR